MCTRGGGEGWKIIFIIYNYTKRLNINTEVRDGGWLYRIFDETTQKICLHQTFVPFNNEFVGVQMEKKLIDKATLKNIVYRAYNAKGPCGDCVGPIFVPSGRGWRVCRRKNLLEKSC